MRTTPWSLLKAELPPEMRDRMERNAEVMSAAFELNDLRKARKLSRDELMHRLEVRAEKPVAPPPAINPRICALRDAVEAMGGELRVTAVFPDGDYPIDLTAERPSP
jgi:hypothetical protein